MSKGLEELKRMAYENACCRCQYYIDKKCTNNYECVWKTIEKELVAFDFFLDNTIIDLGFDEEENAYCVTINGGKILVSEEEYNLIKEVKQSE